jgi:protein SCO1/2
VVGRRALAGWLAALLFVFAAACSRQAAESFKTTDITGAPYGRRLALTDHTGKPRNLEDFKGKAVVLFFGYAQCPDVCPTTLALLKDVKERLGPDGGKVQVLFVTVDPERDTQQVLAAYVQSFGPDFVGLYGDLEATQQAAKEFKIHFAKSAGATPTSYTVDHSSAVYILDTQGRLRLFAKPDTPVDAYVHDIKLLLAAK